MESYDVVFGTNIEDTGDFSEKSTFVRSGRSNKLLEGFWFGLFSCLNSFYTNIFVVISTF